MQKTLKDRTDQAIANGMRIMGQGTMSSSGHHFWLVCSEGYASGNNTAYVVEQLPGHLTCNCPDPKPCKHICLVSRTLTQALKDERQQPTPCDDINYAGDAERAEMQRMNEDYAEMMREEQAKAERLLGLPRELTSAQVSEAEKLERIAIVEKLAEPMKQNAAPWEVERYKALTLADEKFMQMALAAQRDQAESVPWEVQRRRDLADFCTDDHLCRCPRCRPQPSEEIALVEQMIELEHDDAMLLLDRETPDDEWKEEEAETVLTIGQRAERATLADHSPEEFSIYR